MDRAIISALAAILGSLVGGGATIATAWLTRRTQGRRASVDAEVRKREALYVEFISEGSKISGASMPSRRSSIESGSFRPTTWWLPPIARRLTSSSPTSPPRSRGRNSGSSRSSGPPIRSRSSARRAGTRSTGSSALVDGAELGIIDAVWRAYHEFQSARERQRYAEALLGASEEAYSAKLETYRGASAPSPIP